MDKIAGLKSAIKKVLHQYMRERPLPDSEVAYKVIADDAQGQYQLLVMGWQQRRRIYHVLFHLEILEGKIWIQEDNTEDSMAELLVQEGVPANAIVLGYFSPFHRRQTAFAPA
ncbi:MAG: XisI protein [Saprospiraceae bacterium]